MGPMGPSGEEDVIYSARVVEPCLVVLVVGIRSVRSRVGGVQSCCVAGFLVCKMCKVHGTSIRRVQSGIPVPPSQGCAALLLLCGGNVGYVGVNGCL